MAPMHNQMDQSKDLSRLLLQKPMQTTHTLLFAQGLVMFLEHLFVRNAKLMLELHKQMFSESA